MMATLRDETGRRAVSGTSQRPPRIHIHIRRPMRGDTPPRLAERVVGDGFSVSKSLLATFEGVLDGVVRAGCAHGGLLF